MLPNGFLAEKFSSMTSFPVATIVYYACYPGYSLKEGSSKTITCLEGSTWGPIQTSCEPRNCGNPGEILNGYYRAADGTTLGKKVYFFCDEGYLIVGRDYRVCVADGWDGQVPRCDMVSCDYPASISNGKVTAPPKGDTWTSGMIAQYSCNGDYSLIGEEQLTCTISGKWDKAPPKCKVVQCQRPPDPANSNAVNGFGPTYKYHDSITYRCKDGYEMVGANVIRCNETSMFEPSPPICRPLTPTTTVVPPTTTAVVEPESQTGIIIGIVIAVIIIIVAVILVLCYCCKKKKEGQYTTSEKVAMNLQSEQVQEKSNYVDC
ncbi:C4b-binding protein alpha chain-like isoform X3 [Scyliorhinus torazame]|uniref:C4b-binding protein alpha chain-like isoform X3 n=1 Tax=Scyliorhinus torazame TaxID=75743 RepID=UPI003B59410A